MVYEVSSLELLGRWSEMAILAWDELDDVLRITVDELRDLLVALLDLLLCVMLLVLLFRRLT